ncbi:acyl-CoA carboxylase subunit epsilon [Nocardia sp. NPDC057227]|uniref:acyl-CoA carboxylase subunit epsilon n=1 Tax=Nocardia sp. NPDC057227 TaxID=3346056 RepID=UPI003626B498
MTEANPVFLTVTRGSVDLYELGALTAVLHARTASTATGPMPARPAATWRRTERRPGYTDPRSWANPIVP